MLPCLVLSNINTLSETHRRNGNERGTQQKCHLESNLSGAGEIAQKVCKQMMGNLYEVQNNIAGFSKRIESIKRLCVQNAKILA